MTRRALTLTELILREAQERPDRPCLVVIDQGRRCELSRRQLADEVRDLLVGFDILGLRKGDSVGFRARNRWEWVALDLAAMGAGLIVVPLDPAWSDTRTSNVLRHANIRCICTETRSLGTRLRDLYSSVTSVVVLDETAGAEGVVTREELAAAGRRLRAQSPSRETELLSAVGDDDIATIIHTGGSTGEPKGVVRTHRNTSSQGWALFPWEGNLDRPTAGDELLLDPLSFCHSAGRWWCHMALAQGRAVALTSAGTETLSLEDLQALRPTHLATVPRVILQLQKLLMPHLQGLFERLQETESPPRELQDEFASALRDLLGGRLRRIDWGGGRLAQNLHRFFETYGGIAVTSGYGGTEIGIVAIQDEIHRFGTAGRVFGAAVRIEDGEILVRGPGVTPGYYENSEATARARVGHGWWRTGDLGRFDEDGHLVIVGRANAMFTCNEGTNIDPTELEQVLEADPYIRQAILVGHQRPFLAALLVANRDQIAKDFGEAASFDSVVAARLDRLNRNLEQYERVERFVLVDDPFTPDMRQVTIANKIRIDRTRVEQIYAEAIDSLYKLPVATQ